MRKFASILLSALLIAIMGSCQDDGVHLEEGIVDMAVIQYTYKVDPEMLYYFNITVNYTNPDGNRVSEQMRKDSIVVRTSTTTFPADRSLTFAVSRRDVPNPQETPHWQTSIHTHVDVYLNNNTTNTAESSQTNIYSPLPASFDTWASQYISRMAVGYQTFVTDKGVVNFSTD